MASAKYNWQEIKQLYFESDIIEVQEFLVNYLGITRKQVKGGFYNTKTTGWRAEKEELRKAQTEKAKKEFENDPEVKIANQNILSAIQQYELNVANLIQSEMNLNKALASIPLWQILRVSQNLPTAFVKSDNLNKNLTIKDLADELNKLNDVN